MKMFAVSPAISCAGRVHQHTQEHIAYHVWTCVLENLCRCRTSSQVDRAECETNRALGH